MTVHCRENSVKSVALNSVHSSKRGYPVNEGAHLAISKYLYITVKPV
jgi:hypothetical protein